MTLAVLTAEQTAELLPFDDLCDHIRDAVRDYAAGSIQSPERQVLAMGSDDALLLSMPATSPKIGIHKLVNVVASNSERGLPTIHGLMAVYSAVTGELQMLLDGPTVTARRTAAVTMVGIKALTPTIPRHFSLIGVGTQANGHIEAIASLYPGCRVDAHGRDQTKVISFCERYAHLPLNLTPGGDRVSPNTEVVITLTNSNKPIYAEAVSPGRLLVGVGAFTLEMAEYASSCVNASQLFVDDPVGAPHEAGDFAQAGVDWKEVISLADALDRGFDPQRPRIFKTVGCAAWDLAAGRCAMSVARLGH